MPSVVAEGRRVVNNIERTAALYIVKNIFSMLLAIFSVILMLDYPLEPSQVSLISMFTIGIPSFVLALEPRGKPLNPVLTTRFFVSAMTAPTFVDGSLLHVPTSLAMSMKRITQSAMELSRRDPAADFLAVADVHDGSKRVRKVGVIADHKMDAVLEVHRGTDAVVAWFLFHYDLRYQIIITYQTRL
jgi:hypothetical protein